MDFFGFVSGLFGGVGALLSSIVNAILSLLKIIIQVFVIVWQGILAVLKYGVKALQAVGTFFKHVWENGLKPIFGKIGEVISKAHQWLEAHLRPIIEWLRKAQAWLERHVWRPLRAYIQFLQRVRRYLTVLRLLHIKWAEALDRRLARTEAELAHAFLLVRGILNQVINWVNVASDPLRLGRMVIVSVLGRRSAAAMVRILTGLPIGIFFPHIGKGSHLYEHPIVSSKDLSDPKWNPPASQILFGLSPLPTDGFEGSDPTPDDAAIDGIETLGFFDDMRADLAAMSEFFDPLDDPRISITDTIVEGKGSLYEAGAVLRSGLSKAVVR